MSPIDNIFSEDIVLDEAAFDKAITEFATLRDQLKQLRKEIEDMLNILKTGFDTPAGVKFINSCEKNLFKPIDDQEIVLKHIYQTLEETKQAYSSVFEEYEALQNKIKNINN